MWKKKSNLELFSLVSNSKSNDETIKELIKRLKNDNCFDKSLINKWIKTLEGIIKKEEYKKENSINRVLESIYDQGDALRIWVS